MQDSPPSLRVERMKVVASQEEEIKMKKRFEINIYLFINLVTLFSQEISETKKRFEEQVVIISELESDKKVKFITLRLWDAPLLHFTPK